MAPPKNKQRAGPAPTDNPDTTDPGTTSPSGDPRDEQQRRQPSLLERINAATIDELAALLVEERMEEESEEWRTIQLRIRQYKTLVGLRDVMHQEESRKRARDDDESPREEEPKGKRREVKYTNISKLTPQTTPREYAEWKDDMQRLFTGAPAKYDTDTMKMIAAHEYMSQDAKALWATHTRLCSGDTNSWNNFLQWTTQLISQGADLTTTIHKEYAVARQGPSQAPQHFHAYLSSLESLLGELPEEFRAQNFFNKLRSGLQKQMNLSGRETMPTTRQAMVAFASRVWHGLGQDNLPQFQTLGRGGRGGSDNYHRGRGGQRGGRPTPASGQGQFALPSHDRGRGRGSGYRGRGRGSGPHGSHANSNPNPYQSGVNEKGERCCYKCGNTGHIARFCDKTGPANDRNEPSTAKDKPSKIKTQPHVNTLSSRVEELSDSSFSDSENE